MKRICTCHVMSFFPQLTVNMIFIANIILVDVLLLHGLLWAGGDTNSDWHMYMQ